MTRAVGDVDCAPIVSAEPDYTALALPPNGGVVLIGSRGIWDRLSGARVADVVKVRARVRVRAWVRVRVRAGVRAWGHGTPHLPSPWRVVRW